MQGSGPTGMPAFQGAESLRSSTRPATFWFGDGNAVDPNPWGSQLPLKGRNNYINVGVGNLVLVYVNWCLLPLTGDTSEIESVDVAMLGRDAGRVYDPLDATEWPDNRVINPTVQMVDIQPRAFAGPDPGTAVGVNLAPLYPAVRLPNKQCFVDPSHQSPWWPFVDGFGSDHSNICIPFISPSEVCVVAFRFNSVGGEGVDPVGRFGEQVTSAYNTGGLARTY